MTKGDLSYFSEQNLCKDLRKLHGSLPDHLKNQFKASLSNKIDRTNNIYTLQGYQGPPELCNYSSGDTHVLCSFNGVQQIKFWYGMSKYANLVPILGPFIFLLGRLIQHLSGELEWITLYFDEKSHKCLGHDINKAADKLFYRGDMMFFMKRYTEAAEYYSNACKLIGSSLISISKNRDSETVHSQLVKKLESTADTLSSIAANLLKREQFSMLKMIYRGEYLTVRNQVFKGTNEEVEFKVAFKKKLTKS